MIGSLIFIKKGLPYVDGCHANLYLCDPYIIKKETHEPHVLVPKKTIGFVLEVKQRFIKVLICDKIGWINKYDVGFINELC